MFYVGLMTCECPLGFTFSSLKMAFRFDDAKREDLVTLVFHLWTFSLAFVTVTCAFMDTSQTN